MMKTSTHVRNVGTGKLLWTAICALVVLAAFLAVGCGSSIGDDCGNNSECPSGSFCDETMPGGLCTISPCRPGECPGSSVCVEFYNGETFCLAACEVSDDCRDGYDCISNVGPYPFCSVKP